MLDDTVSAALSSLGYLPRLQIDGCLSLVHVCNAQQALVWRKASVQAPCRHSALLRVLIQSRPLMLQFMYSGPYFILLHALKLASRAVDVVSIVAEPGGRLSAPDAHLLLVNAANSSAFIGSPHWMLLRVSWIRKRLTLAWDLGLNLCLALKNPSLLINGC